MERTELSTNERRLIEANTTLVDKNKLLMDDIKKLVNYILRPETSNVADIEELANYYDNFTYYREEMDKYAPQKKENRSSND